MSTKDWIAIVAGIVGTVLGAIVQPIVTDWTEQRRSKEVRIASGVPEIMRTKWDAEWNFQDGTPYTKEVVTFEKWTKNSQFEGYGEVIHDGKQYKYSIRGDVSPKGIVALTYKAERFPTEANIGTACLQLSTSAGRLDGFWSGLVGAKGANGKERSELRNGTVIMKKIKDLSP